MVSSGDMVLWRVFGNVYFIYTYMYDIIYSNHVPTSLSFKSLPRVSSRYDMQQTNHALYLFSCAVGLYPGVRGYLTGKLGSGYLYNTSYDLAVFLMWAAAHTHIYDFRTKCILPYKSVTMVGLVFLYLLFWSVVHLGR